MRTLNLPISAASPLLYLLLSLLINPPLFLAASCTNASSQTELKPVYEQDPFVQQRKLGRGVNMGNALEASPGEGSWGVVIQSNYFTLIKQAGFDTVRIPIRWSAHASYSEPFAIDAEFFSRVDQVIGWAMGTGLNVVINVHHYNETGHNIYDTNTDAETNRLAGLWRQIALRYKDKTDRLYYELLNEPYVSGTMSYSKWNGLVQSLVNEIRQIDPFRTVIITPLGWDWYAGLQNLALPTNTNIIATTHFYDPFIFTHQGADWTDPSVTDLSNVLWPNQPPGPTNNVPIPSGAPSWISEQITAYNSFDVNMTGGENNIAGQFSGLSNWSAMNHCPVWIGEFGSYGGPSNRNDMPSRINWTGFVRNEASKHGLTWAYWEFCAGFGIYEYPDGPWRPELVDALLTN